ncbi:MAG: response regulator transcription factor [Bacteroidetes bacterium]|nr:response regulator transcription factor [Bacteroidota bacterium]
MKAKILIVDDHALLRKGVHSIISAHHPEWEVYEAENGIQSILKANDVKPDLILMDYHMPKLDGISAATAIHREYPAAKIIMVSMDVGEEEVGHMIDAGVMGIVHKESPEEELLKAISEVRDGQYYLKGKIGALANQYRMEMLEKKKKRVKSHDQLLSRRENDVLKLLVKGLSRNEIAEKFTLSKRTVEKHIANIYKKTNTHSVYSLIRFTLKNGVLGE